MLTFYFEDGCVMTLRNSGASAGGAGWWKHRLCAGTEPKLKYYIEANDGASKAAARRKGACVAVGGGLVGVVAQLRRLRGAVDELTSDMVRDFMQPDRFGLVAKPAQ